MGQKRRDNLPGRDAGADVLLKYFYEPSLPEVATQYVQSGEITAQIRGSGTVTANGTYDIILPQSREVESVKVREGDTVKEGDVLFTLTAAKSDDLRQAQDSLRTLVLNYSKALIDASKG
jgi:multidrug efflux pump subunit AcrA (membrane-fusion protein)